MEEKKIEEGGLNSNLAEKRNTENDNFVEANEMVAPQKIQTEREKVARMFNSSGVEEEIIIKEEKNMEEIENYQGKYREEKKSSNGFLVFLIIILLVALGVAVYFALTFFNNSKNQAVSSNSFKDKNFENKDSRIIELENGETWVKYEEKKVNLEVFYSESCGEKCATDDVEAFLKSKIPTLEIKKTDIDKAENKDLKYIPVFVFDEKITQTDFYNQAKDLFVEKNGKFMFDSVKIGFSVGKQLAEMSNKGFITGMENAELTVISVSDFGSEKCAIADPILNKLETEYKSKVKFIHKIVTDFEDEKMKNVSMAVFCADEQKGFTAFSNMLFARRANWIELKTDIMPVLETYAVNSKLNKAKFSECLLSKKFEQEIKNMNVEIEEFGISGVPVYFVNGEKFEGVPTYEGMKAMIDKALVKNVTTTTNSSDKTTTNSNN